MGGVKIKQMWGTESQEVAMENNAGRWGKMKTELVNGSVNLEVTGES